MKLLQERCHDFGGSVTEGTSTREGGQEKRSGGSDTVGRKTDEAELARPCFFPSGEGQLGEAFQAAPTKAQGPERTLSSQAHVGSHGQASSTGETRQDMTLEQWAGGRWERAPKACLRTARTSPEAVGSRGRILGWQHL